MKPIIEVNHVWKEYQKGIDRRYKSLRDTLVGIPGRFFGEQKEKFWALEDIDFKVEAGESIGIIGRNGAGKSTLLKILSRITPPTKGEIVLRGRVASLLEVGTGFHPELTGRENVFFNGSILGMKNQEIKRKFDEIVDFSGVESFIDTPLKHYSSGMQMRLAFSVAAHLDSEILLIDEVLAVGDAEFQKKCIGKMDEVSTGEGKTILFVSHNMNQLISLCESAVLINSKQLSDKDNISIIIDAYQNHNLKFNSYSSLSNEKINIYHFKIKKENDCKTTNSIFLGDGLVFDIKFQLKEKISNLSIALDIRNSFEELIAHITNEDDDFLIKREHLLNETRILIHTNAIFFTPGIYKISIWFGQNHISKIFDVKNIAEFEVLQSNITKRTRSLPQNAKIFIKTNWSEIPVN